MYLNIKSSKSKSERLKFEALLHDLILLEDSKVFTSLWIIHRFSIKLYTETINDGVPNVLYLADYALYHDDEGGFYDEA